MGSLVTFRIPTAFGLVLFLLLESSLRIPHEEAFVASGVFH